MSANHARRAEGDEESGAPAADGVSPNSSAPPRTPPRKKTLFFRTDKPDTFTARRLFQYSTARNVGSRARDLLALERTFLSMVRTSLAAVALGVAIAKLIDTRLAEATGTVFIALGLATLVVSLWRYYGQMLALERGEFAADTIFPWIVVVFLVAAGVVSLVLLFK